MFGPPMMLGLTTVVAQLTRNGVIFGGFVRYYRSLQRSEKNFVTYVIDLSMTTACNYYVEFGMPKAARKHPEAMMWVFFLVSIILSLNCHNIGFSSCSTSLGLTTIVSAYAKATAEMDKMYFKEYNLGGATMVSTIYFWIAYLACHMVPFPVVLEINLLFRGWYCSLVGCSWGKSNVIFGV
ncbi:hypothetical protein M5689_006390 [Euphorbia peplus]|nr:hypothetical protein M5689_006390 [Euphorbia peplus]